jgi:methylase of polypeptide subunit release factors
VTADDALLELLAQLQSRNYRFTAVTPGTHARVLQRPRPGVLTLRDIFGWNRPFEAADIDRRIFDLLRHAGAVEKARGGLRSRVRVASLCDRLFLHSSFPTEAADSVFFGPDTYRFCSFVASELSTMKPSSWMVDMGAGSGAGGIIAASAAQASRLSLIDINPAAARLARLNARFAGVAAEVVVADRVSGGCDVVIANPPYLIDSANRTYRHGGRDFGGEVALRWARQSLSSLTPGGSSLLYTGAAIVDGRSPLLEAISDLARETSAHVTSRELDPDVFGEELVRPEYADVERIAAIGIKMVKR